MEARTSAAASISKIGSPTLAAAGAAGAGPEMARIAAARDEGAAANDDDEDEDGRTDARMACEGSADAKAAYWLE
jgi:hypothetical protein